jgi:small neutral amino acid transporter SnatA (MarC family)
MNILAVLPQAVVMVAGPQIISSFFFATSEKWRGDSAAYVLGAAIGLFAVITTVYLVASGSTSGGSESE